MDQGATAQPKSVVIEAVVIRADGSVQNLGAVNRTYSNPLKQAWWTYVGKPFADARIKRVNRAHERAQR